MREYPPKRKSITVYVRRPGDGTPEEGRNRRTITFQFPGEISHEEIIKHNFAVDGTAAFTEIERRKLQEIEMELIEWLGEHGYAVKFG